MSNFEVFVSLCFINSEHNPSLLNFQLPNLAEHESRITLVVAADILQKKVE